MPVDNAYKDFFFLLKEFHIHQYLTQIISYLEGYIIVNESSNSPCPQFSWLGDECITWEMIASPLGWKN